MSAGTVTISEASRILGVSERSAYRLCSAYRLGVAMSYVAGRPVYRQRYAAQPIHDLAHRRANSVCEVCEAPARPTASTCGSDSCLARARRARQAAS